MKSSLLRQLSLGYLILPNLIFFVTWFRLPVALILVLGFTYVFWSNMRIGRDKNISFEWREIISLSLIALTLAAFSGIGGLSFQVVDYWSHNAKYSTLVSHSWPVIFAENGRYASHYFGFFLVPALVSKILGSTSDMALNLWASLGLFFGLCWVYLFAKKRIIAFFLLFCLGGAGHLLKVVFLRFFALNFFVPPFFVEIWPFLYQVQWAPNQLIPTLVVAGIVFYDYLYLDKPENSFLAIILLFTWGVFPGIIFTAVFAALIFLKYYQNLLYLFQFHILKDILLIGLLFIPIFLYLLSASGAVEMGFIWQFRPLNEIAFHYFFGVVIEIIILYAVVLIFGLHKTKFNATINVLFVLLITMSLFRMGKWNDWFLRGNTVVVTLIVLFIIHRFSFWTIENPYWYKRKLALVLLPLLLIGVVVPCSLAFKALKTNRLTNYVSPSSVKFKPYPYHQYEDFYQMGKVVYSQQEADQWAAAKGSFYERYLAPQ